MEIIKIRDSENLKISQARLRNFQKEMRYIDLKNIDELEEEYITYLRDRKPNMTLEQMDTVSETFEYMRNRIRQSK
ncbi:hypothetical protein G8V07_12465 [Clostridium botulinum D/C]|uniref:hypothetical protein n=1 Tax=Clostridium botulinum TaxID=1491 RepID=UPI001E46C9E0|nr:hypothetical protein [Clostridium botulinum]MCD3321123.1 hypothetical protein [Clostridium botulinum D/C]MCD3324563.1 hypothetical protein [Clostridium botulinum D/C]MCD3326871.1 hypothetical protein [Clostridium botulinum D/C]